MKLILSAGSLFTLPAPRVFELAREVGFDGMEVIINNDFGGGHDVRLLRSLQNILPVHSIHAPFFDIDGWGNKIDQLKSSVDLALETGVPLINFHPPSWLNFELKFWRWLKGIDDFQADLGQGRVMLTLENMPCMPKPKLNPYLLSTPEKMIPFLKEHNLFLTFDTAHCGSMHTNFINDFYAYYSSGMMRNIHFSDYANGEEHLMPGHGALPLTRFLNHLRETGYNHSLVLELSPYEFPEEHEGIRDTLAEMFRYLCLETRQSPPPAPGLPSGAGLA
ncbi:MAG: sugar phosphate isomerase/epimerase [Desulfuromonas sp.]|nr:sugar phosphate isomerase/epimerase [Desulfuromonas sp.]